MTQRSKDYIKRKRSEGVIVVKAMIPAYKKDDLAMIAKAWRDEHRDLSQKDTTTTGEQNDC